MQLSAKGVTIEIGRSNLQLPHKALETRVEWWDNPSYHSVYMAYPIGVQLYISLIYIYVWTLLSPRRTFHAPLCPLSTYLVGSVDFTICIYMHTQLVQILCPPTLPRMLLPLGRGCVHRTPIPDSLDRIPWSLILVVVVGAIYLADDYMVFTAHCAPCVRGRVRQQLFLHSWISWGSEIYNMSSFWDLSELTLYGVWNLVPFLTPYALGFVKEGCVWEHWTK